LQQEKLPNARLNSACEHHLQDLTRLLDCPASEALRRAIFDTIYILTSDPDLWRGPTVWYQGIPLRFRPSEGVG